MNPDELNSYVTNLQREDGPLPPVKDWKKFANFRDHTVFVGSNSYVIVFAHKVAEELAKDGAYCEKWEKIILNYLMSEGLVSPEHLYMVLSGKP